MFIQKKTHVFMPNDRLKNLSDKTWRHPQWGQCFVAVFSVLILEIVARASILSAFVWAVTMPHRFIFFACLFLLFTRAAWAVVGTYRLAWVFIFAPALVLSLIHSAKFSARNEPLFPWDLVLFNEGKAIISLEFFPFSVAQIAGILVLLAATAWIAWFLPRRRMKIGSRIFSLILSSAILAAIFGFRYMDSWREFCLTSGFHPWNQNQTTARLGFLPTFLMNLPSAVVSPPPGYSPEQAVKILSKFSCDNRKAGSYIADKPVNLIIFLAEAFWDPAGLKKIIFEKDPVPNFHRIMRDHLNLELISPVLAGNTCNVELELLTGLSMAFFPAGSIPYQQYIHREVKSLASVLANNGYQTLAIHPFHKWFFKRDRVYPLLGFHKFISMETMVHKNKSGDFISDTSLANEIIDTASNLSEPFFIFAVSMENHSPYSPGRYAKKFQDTTFEKTASILNEKQFSILQTYVTGIHHADLALGKLIKHFSRSQQKTMIVFVGDHLPYLDSGYNIFKDAEYLDSDQIYPKMFTEKAVIWTNYKTGRIKFSKPLSYSYLPVILLKMMGISPTPFFAYLESIMIRCPIVHVKDVDVNDIINNYRMVQYNRVFD